MDKFEKIECKHDTAKKIMYHTVGDRVTIITNVPAGVIKFYKDGKKYNEISSDIKVEEFERILARTEREVEQLERIEGVKS